MKNTTAKLTIETGTAFGRRDDTTFLFLDFEHRPDFGGDAFVSRRARAFRIAADLIEALSADGEDGVWVEMHDEESEGGVTVQLGGDFAQARFEEARSKLIEIAARHGFGIEGSKS